MKERDVTIPLHAPAAAPAEQPAQCPDNLPPDGPVCPRCGGKRGPSGVGGGSWVHLSPTERDVMHAALKSSTTLVARGRLAEQPAQEARPVAWMHPDGRIVPAATMDHARESGGASLTALRGFTIALAPLAAPPAHAEARDAKDVEVEFQIAIEDEVQASACGPLGARDRVWAEAMNYARQYAQDGDVEIWEVHRWKLDAALGHDADARGGE